MATLTLDDLKIAQNYAKALLDCAADDNEAKQLHDGLVQLRDVVNSVPELGIFLGNPQIADAEKQALASEHLTQGQDSRIVTLVQLLLTNKRSHLLAGVAEQYETLLNQQTQTAKAKLTTAVEISDDLESKIRQSLQSLYGYQRIDVDTMVNPDILGGAIVQIDDHLIDGSYRTRLRELAKSL